MTITKQQVLELASENASLRARMEDMFPEAFEPTHACKEPYDSDEVAKALRRLEDAMGIAEYSFSPLNADAVRPEDYRKGLILRTYDWDIQPCKSLSFGSHTLIPYKRTK